MEGYTDTILIDCNRINSEEKKGGNPTTPALFTNKIGTGLKLNPGDKVSVHSGFISERGAGGDVIELTGKKKNYTYTLSELELNLYQPRYAIAIDGTNHTGRMGELQPYNHHCNTFTPVERTYQLQDNIGHMQINYYKTSNGEGYFHLPRRYDAGKAPYDENPIDLWQAAATAVAPAPDGEYPQVVDGGGIPTVPFWYSLYNSNTANLQSNGALCDSYNNGRPMTNWAYDYNRCLDDIEYYNLPGIDVYAGVPDPTASRLYKKKNDNSRYTIFVKEISYWGEWRCVGKFVGEPDYLGRPGLDGAANVEPIVRNTTASRHDLMVDNPFFVHNRDPALTGYVRYNEIKEVTIDTLHSAPENIADNITNQLNTVVTDKPIRGEVGGTFIDNEKTAHLPTTFYEGRETRNIGAYNSAGGQQSLKGVNIGRKVESECFKTFPCGNARTFDKEHYEAYWTGETAQPKLTSTGTSVMAPFIEESSKYEITNVGTTNWVPLGATFSAVGEIFEAARDGTGLDGDGHANLLGIMPRNAYEKQDLVQNYLSAYSTIGVKRADLFEVGREVAAMSPGKADGVAIAGVGPGDDEIGSLYSWRNVWHPWIMNTAVVNVPQNPTSLDLTGINRGIADVILSYEWNDANLELLKRYFDTQAKYPELWTGYNGGNAGEWNSEYKKEGLLNTNSRFWHMNPVDGTYFDENNQRNPLGNDNYENMATISPTAGITVAASDIVVGQVYQILTKGTTHWQDFGSADSDVGTVFTCNLAPGIGTGTATLYNTFTNKQSIPLFFYCDESRSEISSGGHTVNDLYYGMFIKRTAFFPTDTPENRYDVIGVTTEKIGGVPDYLWGQGEQIDEGPPAPADGTRIGSSFSRTIGVDVHFNAYGTDAICLYSGLLDATPTNKDPGVDGDGVPNASDTPNSFPNQVYYAHDEAAQGATMDQGWYQTSTQIRERYCGANQVQMNFDTSASRFNFQLLHTPENIGNSVQAGFPATEDGGDDAVAELEGAKNPVIKINKRLFPTEYCPDMKPYTSKFPANFYTTSTGAANKEGQNIEDPYNSNMTEWSIFDADCGIFIDNFGITDETMWNNSLWGILGFSYNQFNSATTLNRQTRITNSVVQDNIGAITTNANINAAEVKKFSTNINGVPLFNTAVGTPLSCVNQAATAGFPAIPWNRTISPPITIDALSAQVNAQNLPRKMLSPYFLVKSSIIGDVSFLGGADSGQALPVMYVVNKENGFGDFYFQGESQNEFTITKSKTVTEITTSIHNADFELAPVDENSAIIYKITKQIPANMNVAEEVLKNLKK